MTRRLQEYIDVVESDAAHVNGTYAELVPSVKSLRVIEKIIRDLKIAKPTPSNLIHTTLVYSRTPCPALADLEFPGPVSATVTGFGVFPLQAGGFALVLHLNSPQMSELHQQAIDLGCTHGYPEYNPHVTLTYEWSDDHLPELSVKGINLTFDHWNVKPLDPTFVPGRNNA